MTVRKIAYQGEPGANSHIACAENFPDLKPLPRATFEDAFAAVQDGAAELAMIPIENSIAGRVAERWGLGLELDAVGRWAPALTDERARRAIAGAAQRLGYSAIEMPSGAGHDAQVMARITTTGMVFIPSRDGISHHPDEHSDLQDCINGTNVLLGAALALAADSGH